MEETLCRRLTIASKFTSVADRNIESMSQIGFAWCPNTKQGSEGCQGAALVSCQRLLFI